MIIKIKKLSFAFCLIVLKKKFNTTNINEKSKMNLPGITLFEKGTERRPSKTFEENPKNPSASTINWYQIFMRKNIKVNKSDM